MSVRRVKQFKLSVEHKPGVLSGVVKVLKEHSVDLQGLWGFGIGPDRGEIILQPRNPDQFRDVAARVGWSAEELTAFEIAGEDRLGALVETLEKVSTLNLEALNAVALEGRFGGAVWVQPGDEDKAQELLTS